MIRRLGLTLCFIVAGAVPALAQTHSGSHARRDSHGPGHVRPDSDTHAAMHGNWTGTLSSLQGVSSGLDMSIAHDSLRKVTLTLRTDRAMQPGPVRDIVLNGDKLQWTQDLSGASCKATAVLTAATKTVPETIKGKMACPDREMTFSLLRKTA